jgi:hypothetical protein
MTTQVIFKIDKKLKDKAMAKAQHEGVAFAYVLKLATKAFADGELNLGLIGSEKFNASAAKDIANAQNDVLQRKNISPSFRSTKKAIDFLKK